MPEFVLNRRHTLAQKGHIINFEKGQPTWVPPELVKEAAAIGAERVDGKFVDPLAGSASEEKPPVVELTDEERTEEMYAAFEMLVERNNSKDFGGDGRPTLGALHKLISFETSKKEVAEKWVAYKIKKDGE